MAKLIKISKEDRSITIGDIVFLHGLNGDAHKTWGFDQTIGWHTWLQQDCPEVALWSMSYNASPTAWFGSAMPLTDLAINALAVLDGHNIGSRPIVFIAHSMGGLLTKQALRHADSYAVEFANIVKNTQGIIFLGTPHTGLDVATLVNYLGVFMRTSIAVNELKAQAPALRELNLWFRNSVSTLATDVKVFYETQTTYGINVVTPSSADPGIPNVIPLAVDSDHFAICKPETHDDIVYVQSLKLIKNTVEWFKKRKRVGEKKTETKSQSVDIPLLRIERHGTASLKTELSLPSGKLYRGLMPFHESEKDGGITARINAFPKLSYRYENFDVVEYIRNFGHELYKTMISQPVKNGLESLPPSTIEIAVAPELQYLPWGMMYDGEDFFGLKYALGRRVSVDSLNTTGNHIDNTVNDMEDIKIEDLKILVISAEESLFAYDEGWEVGKFFESYGASVQVVAGANHEIASMLYEGYNIVHLIGHQSDEGLHLSDGFLDFATVKEIISRGKNNCLMFLDVCESGLFGSNREMPSGYKLASKNLTVVSPLTWVSSDRIYETFYQNVLCGKSVGESLRLAKVLASEGSPKSGWWQFTLFGDPLLHLV